MKNGSLNLEEKLKEEGYKLTSQRKVILGAIEDNDGKHLSTEEIYASVKKNHPEIGLATVYRTLLLFEKMGIVEKLNLDDGFSRYELNRERSNHKHHHLICNICGAVLEMEDDLLETLEQQIFKEQGFVVTDHRVKFYGKCKNCSR